MNAGAAFQGAVWSSGPFEPIAAGAAAAHDTLVTALGPSPGLRWLDVATGTGPVALRAARAGAVVTALDVAPALLATARARAQEEGLSLRFDLAAAEDLPYPDESFDVVSSAQGVIFALDPAAAAAELARVTRPGGLLGLTCLIRSGFSAALGLRVGAGGRALDWGDKSFIRRLFARSFELSFSRGDAPFLADSPEGAAALYVRCYGPLRFFADRYGAEDRRELERELVALFAQYTNDDGVSAPRPYLLVIGRRRITHANA